MTAHNDILGILRVILNPDIGEKFPGTLSGLAEFFNQLYIFQ
jgi:hypothetical protein